MKKSFCITAMLLLAATFSAKAQIQKGNYLIGGDLSNFDFSISSRNYFTMTINPKVAWFIKSNTAVGGYLTLSFATAKGAGTNFGYGVGALARKYMSEAGLNVVHHSRWFFEGNAGIEGQNYSKGASTNGLGLGIGPGLAYFVTPNIGLEGLVKFNTVVGFGSAVSSSHLNLNLGFQVYLSRKTVESAIANP